MNKSNVILNLRVVASIAAKAASDVESGRLWAGELEAMIAQIDKALYDAAHAAKCP